MCMGISLSFGNIFKCLSAEWTQKKPYGTLTNSFRESSKPVCDDVTRYPRELLVGRSSCNACLVYQLNSAVQVIVRSIYFWYSRPYHDTTHPQGNRLVNILSVNLPKIRARPTNEKRKRKLGVR